MVVITKIDICPPHILEQTVTQITRILKSPGARKIPIFIKNRQECIDTATQFVSQRICPIFQVSNVTGENLDLVRTFLNILPHYGHYDASAPFEFHVNDTFSVPFVGTVVSGIVKSGMIHAGDTVLIGPDSLGNFTTTAIRTIERKRIQVPATSAGQSASFALKRVRRKDVRKGMVVLPKLEGQAPKVYNEFVAEGKKEHPLSSGEPAHLPHNTTFRRQPTTCGDISKYLSGTSKCTFPILVANVLLFPVLILSHATTIKTKYQAMLHVCKMFKYRTFLLILLCEQLAKPTRETQSLPSIDSHAN
jgi:GTPase